jgi:chemotaxis protein methyltransferase CheR
MVTVNSRAEVLFPLFSRLILDRTGMNFTDRRRHDLVRNVADAAGRAGFKDTATYYHHLAGASTESQVWKDLLQGLIVSETYFFRDMPQMNALREHILPELIRRHHSDRRIRIWSAGCSSGEESYTLAMLMHPLLPDITEWNILILATDLNPENLAKARLGCYRESSMRQTDPDTREKFFTKAEGVFEIKPHIRDMVSFAYLNLAENTYPSLTTNTNAMDLILCRNVAIYLKEDVLREMALRFHRCLAPDGWFIVGASEAGSALCEPFIYWDSPGTVLYRKGIAPPHQPGRWAGKPEKEICPMPALFPPMPPLSPQQEAPPVAATVVSSVSCDPSDIYRNGLLLMNEGNYEGAIEQFQAISEKDDLYGSACCRIAQAHANRGRLQAAVSACEDALKRDPLKAGTHYLMGLIFQETGDTEKAVGELKKTLYLNPDFVLAHFSLSVIFRKKGHRQEGMRHQTQALRLAAEMTPETMLPEGNGLTAARLLTMIQEMNQPN